MSRLDSVIRRLQAQRACLQQGVDLVRDLQGPVLELGLGNGRTYDHIREICSNCEIFVFERKVAAHPDCIPDDEHLFLGDLSETLPRAVERFRGQVRLIHSDIGTGDQARNAEIGRYIAGFVPDLLCPGGIIISDQETAFSGAEALALPEGVRPGRYYMYRAGGAA
ncbi:class I SAM-dependent methyltransferase [Denitrobaculum tricleocarpae]|uniref:S-adenosyl-L-methionine methyltransferase n=1 Tax=Denitrobaculum tricleocarpae TaxID=2591009 RepID=A0A545TRN2_9PROT|nr:class I SAM-dependent methyltransferase [Denitrobaculum tricleocarpae]TQV79791.1 hypothetical protein FKG95_13910 [Denitrobaculum tricleocarpae]